jgi:hypothetical protein
MHDEAKNSTLVRHSERWYIPTMDSHHTPRSLISLGRLFVRKLTEFQLQAYPAALSTSQCP